MRKQTLRFLELSALFAILMSITSIKDLQAQRISFGLFGDGLVLTSLNSGTLDFNEKQTLIVSGTNDMITIDLTDDSQLLGIVEIEAQDDLDVTVEINSPMALELQGDPSETIPFELNWAYSNTGTVDIQQAKTNARELPDGFTSATFPIVLRNSGAPGPPPIPPHDEYTAPTAKAYLFIYGSLGPVGGIDAGLYEATIDIYAEYTTYD